MSKRKCKRLKIAFGVPKTSICSKCGKLIDVMEYMARKHDYRNNMCISCTIDNEKE